MGKGVGEGHLKTAQVVVWGGRWCGQWHRQWHGWGPPQDSMGKMAREVVWGRRWHGRWCGAGDSTGDSAGQEMVGAGERASHSLLKLSDTLPVLSMGTGG